MSPRHIKKQHLPEKICVVCGRPFTWRKKWDKVWDEVKYCSQRCRRNRNNNKVSSTTPPEAQAPSS